MEPLEVLRRVAEIRLAIDLDSRISAERFTVSLLDALVSDLVTASASASARTLDTDGAGAEALAGACGAGTEDVYTRKRTAAVPGFTFIVAGELESKMLCGFYDSAINASERERLHDWLCQQPHLGPAFAVALQKP